MEKILLILQEMFRMAHRELSVPELLAGCVLAVFCVMLEKKLHRSGVPWRLLFSVFLVVYITVLRREVAVYDIRAVPFQRMTLRTMYSDTLNAILFVPFGFEFQRRFRTCCALKAAFAGLLLSAFVEHAQLLFSRGFFETEDIIFNTLGALAGSLLARRFNPKSSEDIKPHFNILPDTERNCL